MVRALNIGLLMMGFLCSAPLFADDCACSEKCAQDCSKGHAKDCPCKTCQCSKGTGCDHGKCGHHTQHKK